MNIRVILAAVFIPLAAIIAAVPENTTMQYKLTANQLLDEVKQGMQFVSADQIADMLIQKDPTLRLIDVRSSEEYDKFHLPDAINIPLPDLLSENWEDYIDQDLKMNVFYSNGNTQSNEAWMITRQLGYLNNYVLMGGLNYWAETILNPQMPSQTNPDDEFAKYDLRKGAGQALGGGTVSAESQSPASGAKVAIPVQKKEKKKKVAGGC